MPALPTSVSFTDSAVTEAQFKTAITNQREFLAGLLGTTGNQIDALKTMGVPLNDTVSKTGAYTVIGTDRGVVLLCNGTFTVSLTAAATLGDGFTFAVVNIGTGVITIDPSSTEQIDGASTKIIKANTSSIITTNGTAFYSVGGSSVSAYTGANIAVFDSSGSWTVPDGITSAVITVVGGGGGGSYGVNSRSGGSGGVAIAYCTGISGTLTVTVGSAGAGGNNVNGGAGGTSSVTGTGVSVSATGGSGATTAPANGTSGSGTVTTGTALRAGNVAIPPSQEVGGVSILGGSISPNNTNSASAWSTSGNKPAGQGGGATNGTSGGIGGAVIIEW